MIGGADESDAEDVRPSVRTTTPAPSPHSPPPPIAPPSSPAQPTSLGRRLLGSIRALASHSAPPPAAPAPKVGLGLLLHLSSDHPRLHPTLSASPSPSASASQEDEDGDAAAARPRAAAAAAEGTHSPDRLGDAAATPAPANGMFRQQAAAKRAPHLLQHLRPAGDVAVGEGQEAGFALVAGHGHKQDDQFRASDESGASEEENLAGGKEKVGEQQGASFFKDVDHAAAGNDQQEKVCMSDQPRAARDGDQERDTIHPRDGSGTTCYGIAVEDGQERVEGRATDELGSAESGGAVEDQDAVGQSVIAGIETHAAIDVQDPHKGVDATVLSFEAVSAKVNGSDRGMGKKENVELPMPYPRRPGKMNCHYYMSKGSCSYGSSCQYHHPPLKAKPDGSWCPSEQGKHGAADILELNRIGLPIREGVRNCTYYMRNGACRYGKNCRFNHPEHVVDAQFYAPTRWEDSTLGLKKSSNHHTTLDDTSQLQKSSDDATLDETSYSKKSSDHATLNATLYPEKSSDHATIDDTSTEVLPPNILRMLLPSQNVLPDTEGKMMQVKKDSNWSSTSDDSDGCCSADSSDGPLCKQEHVDYPERPGRSACNSHHPKDKYPTRYHQEIPSLGGVQTEYPERPGEPECPFYMKNRFCRFMSKCRFNHPKDSYPTVQSPTSAKISVTTDEHHQSTRIILEDHMPQQQQYPERPGQPDCRYYLQYRKCKFLSACIFHHPRDGLPVGWNPSGPAHSDQIGPVIHGMPECPFYMKSGKCQFGSACEFRHPKEHSTTKGAFGHKTDLANDNFTRPENFVQKQEQTTYPERPGEPPCFNYMRHGSCRFQMNCKYHHPADRLSRKQYDSTYH